MEGWAAFPTWWVRQGMLKALSADQRSTGAHIAALKVYLAIAITSDYVTRTAEVSVTRLEFLTGLSRPMIPRAVRLLEQMGVLRVDRQAYRHKYTLVQAEGEKHWVKIPIAVVRENLRQLPNGTVSVLAALKLYLVLLTIRQRRSHESPISHRKLQAHTGVRPGLIARGISHLISHGLVRFANTVAFMDAAGHPVNTYYLLGVFREGRDTDDDVRAGQPTAQDESNDDDAPELSVDWRHIETAGDAAVVAPDLSSAATDRSAQPSSTPTWQRKP